MKIGLGLKRNKTFNHSLVKINNLPDEIVSGSRFYTLEDGTKLKSVTTIIQERTDHTYLDEWRARVGEEAANEIMKKALKRGTEVHQIAQDYISNIENTYSNPINLHMFFEMKKILDEHVDNVYGIELPLYSKLLMTAGRTDLVAQYDGINSIIDFKTSRFSKDDLSIENYFIQETCYALMFEEIYKIKIPRIVTIMGIDSGNCSVFVKKASEFYSLVKKIFVDYEVP